jgi:hypothetical protein
VSWRKKSTLSTSDSEAIEVALVAEVVDTLMVVGVVADTRVAVEEGDSRIILIQVEEVVLL